MNDHLPYNNAFEYALKWKRRYVIGTLFILLLLAIFSSSQNTDSLFNFSIFVAVLVIQLLVVFFTRKKFNTIYYIQIEKDRVINLHLLNLLGNQKVVSFPINALKETKLLTFGSKSNGRLILKTFTNTYSYQVIGKQAVDMKNFFG